MKISCFLSAQFDPAASAVEGIDNVVTQAATAEAAGFHAVYLGHHYLAQSAFVQPIPLAGYLASATSRVRIGFGVLLAPLLNPVALAEELVSLDVLSRGRLTVGMGAGYRKRETAAFGVEWGDRLRRLREYVPILRSLWNGEAIDIAGSWGEAPRASLALRPVQPGGPPLWIGAFAEPAVRRAARLDAPWLIGPKGNDAELARLLGIYRDELAERGFSPEREYPMTREAFIADTHHAAVAGSARTWSASTRATSRGTTPSRWTWTGTWPRTASSGPPTRSSRSSSGGSPSSASPRSRCGSSSWEPDRTRRWSRSPGSAPRSSRASTRGP
ncbi:LLM class flavin-dependent oxidoreductase [Streptomyces sp. INA 01156]